MFYLFVFFPGKHKKEYSTLVDLAFAFRELPYVLLITLASRRGKNIVRQRENYEERIRELEKERDKNKRKKEKKEKRRKRERKKNRGVGVTSGGAPRHAYTCVRGCKHFFPPASSPETFPLPSYVPSPLLPSS